MHHDFTNLFYNWWLFSLSNSSNAPWLYELYACFLPDSHKNYELFHNAPKSYELFTIFLHDIFFSKTFFTPLNCELLQFWHWFLRTFPFMPPFSTNFLIYLREYPRNLRTLFPKKIFLIQFSLKTLVFFYYPKNLRTLKPWINSTKLNLFWLPQRFANFWVTLQHRRIYL